MKKLNFKNQVIDDDGELIALLKTSTRMVSSYQFTEKTLEKFLIIKSKQKRAHKPLKLPLYLMGILGLILLTPFFFLEPPKIPLHSKRFHLENIIENIFLQLDLWYTSVLMIISVILMVFMCFEQGLGKSQYQKSNKEV